MITFSKVCWKILYSVHSVKVIICLNFVPKIDRKVKMVVFQNLLENLFFFKFACTILIVCYYIFISFIFKNEICSFFYMIQVVCPWFVFFLNDKKLAIWYRFKIFVCSQKLCPSLVSIVNMPISSEYIDYLQLKILLNDIDWK